MLKTLFVVTHALSVILRLPGTVPLACVTEMNCRDGLGESLTRFREFCLTYVCNCIQIFWIT